MYYMGMHQKIHTKGNRKMTKKTKKRNLVLVAALCLCLVVGGVMALFTDTDTATNTFTIGDVDINLTEPNWDPDNASNLSPGATVAKDPQVVNASETNPCYAFLTVAVPKDTDGELFSYEVNEGWTLLSSETSEEDVNTYVYAYGTLEKEGMTSLAAGETTASLFDNVTLSDRSEFDDDSYDIPVNAYAIQVTDLSADTASGIWTLLQGELN